MRYHRSDLLGKCRRFLKPLCANCHEAIEFTDGGKKKPMEAVNSKLVHFIESGCMRKAREANEALDSAFNSIKF
jgi:hypothetical protein